MLLLLRIFNFFGFFFRVFILLGIEVEGFCLFLLVFEFGFLNLFVKNLVFLLEFLLTFGE